MIGKSALIDGPYRYMLNRYLGPGKTALWIGVNPSTADAEADDQSIRKLYGLGKKDGIGTWYVGNLFAWRATNVKELAAAEDPVGPNCDSHLFNMMLSSDLVIAGWGRIDKVPGRLRRRVHEIAKLTRDSGHLLECWGRCNDGSPVHPLMIPYSSELRLWQ